jgi:hypothetical protein
MKWRAASNAKCARQTRDRFIKCALWLALMIASAASFSAGALERGEFGWRRSEAAGQRPLLVIWIRPRDDTPASELERRKQYYEEIIFGTPQREEAWPERLRRFQPSLVDYYRRMSAGKFEWTRAGFVGPLTVSPPKPFGPLSGPPGDGKMDSDEIARLAVTTAATQGHFDFRKSTPITTARFRRMSWTFW